MTIWGQLRQLVMVPAYVWCGVVHRQQHYWQFVRLVDSRQGRTWAAWQCTKCGRLQLRSSRSGRNEPTERSDRYRWNPSSHP
jgi:hypothetical protein